MPPDVPLAGCCESVAFESVAFTSVVFTSGAFVVEFPLVVAPWPEAVLFSAGATGAAGTCCG